MDHRPSPAEVSRIEKQAKRQNQNELQASQEIQEFMNHTTPQRKAFNSKEVERTQH